MGGILSSLNTSYSGLQAAQVMVDTTGHNISNANNEGYTRQRVETAAVKPINMSNCSWGQGTEVVTIERIHDEFVFARYRKANQEKEFASYEEEVLTEISKYYPEIDDVGIYNDIQNYFDSWKNFANNPGDPAQKLVLAQNTQTLTTNIKDTRDRLSNFQSKIHEEIGTTVGEINRLATRIAELNQKIKEYESSTKNIKANDLRDQRDQAELALSKLANISVFKSGIKANAQVDTKKADFDEQHIIIIGGYAIVDGKNAHKLTADNSRNSAGHYSLYFETQDYKQVNITSAVTGGKLGALYDLGLSREQMGDDCIGKLGKLQNYIDDLDTFAKGLIETTNNIYASSSRYSMTSDPLSFTLTQELTLGSYNINPGTFDYVLYNNQGEELARRTIEITNKTTMSDVISAMNKNVDDNKDNNGINDIDDEFEVLYNEMSKQLQINPKNPSKALYISIQDKGTNLAGAIGLNRFFDGSDAKSISLAQKYLNDPTLLTSYMEPVDGNFTVANAMQQLQYDKTIFFEKDKTRVESTIPAFFKKITTRVATDAEMAAAFHDTKQAVYSAVKQEYVSISQVNIDEEMTNLIKFQSGYTANAKVITTIDQMINTLLGIKQ